MNFTDEELIILQIAVQYAIDNGLVEDIENPELLFSLNKKLNSR